MTTFAGRKFSRRWRVSIAFNAIAMPALLAAALIAPSTTAELSAQLSASPSSATGGTSIKVLGSGFTKNQSGYVALDTATSGPAFRANQKRRPTPSPTPTPAPTATPTPTPTPATAGFVIRCTGGLCLAGLPYRFTGLNIYNANSNNTCWYSMTKRVLSSSLAAIGPQHVFRAWFFQYEATVNGQLDWTVMDATLAAAQAHGERLIATLGDEWGNCEALRQQPLHTLAWYQGGYTEAPYSPNAPLSYRDYVKAVVAHYANNPTILAWQLMNEAEAPSDTSGTCDEASAASAMNAWAGDMAGLVKSIDANHLLSLGTIGSGQCGTSGSDYQVVNSNSNLDMCEYHDYSAPTATMPGDQWNGLAVRISQCATLGKPLFVGEVGIQSADAGSLAVRAADLSNKLATWFANGVVGGLAWDWRNAANGGSSLTGYEIGPNDPALPVLTGN